MSSKAYSVSETKTNTFTANAAGTLFAGEGSKVSVMDRGAVKGALQLAKTVSQQAFAASGAAFQLVDNSNKAISTSGAASLEAVAQAKTDAGQTERLAKIAGVTVGVLALAFMLLKK